MLQFAGTLNAHADGTLKGIGLHGCDDYLVESVVLQSRSIFHGEPTEPALLAATPFNNRWPNGPKLVVTLRRKKAAAA